MTKDEGLKLSLDFRSDTVTRPTSQMYESIVTANLGDDGLDGDPTVLELEAVAAETLGKQEALYVPSATMANLLAILAHAQRQELVFAEASSHIYTAERGAAALTGTFYQPIPGKLGVMDLDALHDGLQPSAAKLRVGLVCLETSHNNSGGAVPPLAHMQAAFEMSRDAGAKVHLDGARMMNAAVALGVPPASVAAYADTISVCLSKGLSAPMGAMLAGSNETIRRCRQLRKMLGGNQRQVGIAAAAGLIAITTMVERLSDDHASARRLANGVMLIEGLRANSPQTNIVQVDVSHSGADAQAWVGSLKAQGVQVRAWGKYLLRCVTHRHIGAADVDTALSAFQTVRDAFAARVPV